MNDINNSGPDPAELASIFDIPAPAAQTEAPAAPAEPAAAEPAPSAPAAADPAPAPAPSPQTPPAVIPSLEQTPVAPAPTAAPADPSAAPPAPAAPAAPDETALKLASYEATIAAQTAELARLRAAPPVPGNEPAQPAAPADEIPQYGLNIPDQLLGAIFNEDPNIARQGLNKLLNDLALIIHTKVRSESRQDLANYRAEVSGNSLDQQRQAEADRMQTEYYTAFPTHKDPIYQPILYAVAGEMNAQFPNAPWTPDYVAALGQRVNARVAALTGQPAPAVPVTPAAPAPAAPPAKPAAFVPTAPRPAAAPTNEAGVTADDVEALFSAR